MIILGRTTEVRESGCVFCGKTMSAATGFANDAQPKPGDATVCMYCSELMVFTDDLSLRRPSRRERKRMLADPNVRMAQWAIRLFHGKH